MASNYADSIVHHARQDLTSEDKRYAAAHLNETDEIRENALAEIRRWIKENDDLPSRIDDFVILLFLRVSKFNLEKAKTRMRNYYNHRSHVPEWHTNKDPLRPELQELLDLGIFLPLRKPDNQGRLIFIVRGTIHEPRIHKLSDIAKVYVLIVETAMKYYPAASIYGSLWFVDITNPTVRLILQLRPYALKNFIHLSYSCFPMRYQKIIMFNMPTLFDVVVRIIKSFITEKLRKRIEVYSHQHCFEDIPTNILPVEYGGTDGTLQELAAYWKKLVEENHDWLTEDENYPFSDTSRDRC